MGSHRKRRRGAPPGFFAAEAAGLAWLAAAGTVPVVAVRDVGPDFLELERLIEVRPTPAAARAFGRGLAGLHDAGAPAFGALPPGARAGFFGPLSDPLPMAAGEHASWGEFHAARRVEPIRDLAVGRGAIEGSDAAALTRLAERLRAGEWDDGDVPARLHGDLWSGNVLWTAAGATLIDPAAHGGHRETDLAMLALFGAPHLAEILAGYQEVHPLRRGWRRRVGLHQVYPLAVHAVLFGRGYLPELRRAVASAG